MKKTVHAEAIKSMVEVIVTKFDCPVVNLKEAIKFLSAVTERKIEEQNESDLDDKKEMRQVGVATLMDLHHQQTIAAVAAVTVKAMIPKMTMRRMEIQPIRRWT
jgi:hypothetical protein